MEIMKIEQHLSLQAVVNIEQERIISIVSFSQVALYLIIYVTMVYKLYRKIRPMKL
jgi:hypothetical protein